MQLRVGRVIPRTGAEGPGQRFAMWVQGCTIRCPGCCNPHLFAAERGQLVAVEHLVERPDLLPLARKRS